MSRKRPESAPEIDGLPTTNQWDRIVSAIETLAVNYETILNEIQETRHAIDRLEDDVMEVILNDKVRREPIPAIPPLHSMPLDPHAPDFGERIDAVAKPETEPEPQVASATANEGTQRQLWR